MLGTHRTLLQPWKAFCLRAVSLASPCSLPPQAALGVTACVPSLTWNQRGKVEGLKLENRAFGDRGKGGEKRKLGREEEETQMLPAWEGALHELWSSVCVCECMGGLEPAREDRPYCTIKALEAEGRGRKGQKMTMRVTTSKRKRRRLRELWLRKK